MYLGATEHVPKKFEHIYLERHVNEGIILIWSKLGQSGLQHVNELTAVATLISVHYCCLF